MAEIPLINKVAMLFPIPVYRQNIGRKIKRGEMKIIREYLTRPKQNRENTSTQDTYILKDGKLDDLHRFFLECASEYVENVITPAHKGQWSITQSWLNLTKPGEAHHHHTHPNSIISGVFYPQTIDNDRIRFHKDGTKEFMIPTSTYNLFNADYMDFPIETGDLILFPSSTPHSVPKNETDQERISLAFNMFTNNLGSMDTLTHLQF